MTNSVPRWAVFISGYGSNLQAILDMNPAIKVALVVSSRADAFGLKRAEKAGVPTLVLSRHPEWQRLHEGLCGAQIDYIFLAGFMKVIPAFFVDLWKNKILNVHPSLLPSYPGTNSIARSYGDKSDMGVTIHVVTAELDGGPVIVQKKVISADETTALSLAECEGRIHAVEHELVTSVIRSWR